MRTYFYEVYTKKPETQESGWDIETGWAEAESFMEAKRKIKRQIADFDVFINCYEANMNPNDILTVF